MPSIPARLRLRRLGLRARIILSFALGAAVLSAVLATTTYVVTRGALLRQREASIVRQAYVNAAVMQEGLQSANPRVVTLLQNLQTPSGARPIIVHEGEAIPLTPEFGIDAVPQALQDRVADGVPARMRFAYRDEIEIAVGIPLPTVSAQYYEIVSLQELASTLSSIALALFGAALLTTALGTILGVWASGRAVRPLADAASAAEAIAGGRLDTRLEPVDDPDLAVLTRAFNDMASALEARVERDARFASDVSHELRSPLMTLSASAEVLQSRRDELPERAATALDLLVADVTRFQGLVEDLLEISRFDAGAVRLVLEEVPVGQLVALAVDASDAGRGVPVKVDDDAALVTIRADKRRMARVIANLLENARHYGGGATSVEVSLGEGPEPSTVQVAFEDDGPGVAPEERHLVFERFARGSSAGRRGATDGAGLGLALVDEHIRLHRGRVWVEDRKDGASGARFVIELPIASTL